MKKIISILVVALIVSTLSISIFASSDIPEAETPVVETVGEETTEVSTIDGKLDTIITLLTPKEEVENEYTATVEYEAIDIFTVLLGVVKQFFITDFGKIITSVIGLCFAIIIIKILMKG